MNEQMCKILTNVSSIIIFTGFGLLIFASVTPRHSLAKAARNVTIQNPSPSPTPTPAIIVFDPPSPSILPGSKITIHTSLRDDSSAKVSSARVARGFEEYLEVSQTNDNVLVLIGLSGPAKSSTPRPTVVPIIVKYGAGTSEIEGVLNVRLGTSAPPAGPIPTSEPQVDVMWSVLPRKIVRDNFGHRVSDQYYGIGMAIGNNSGYSLQLASVGFTVPSLNQRVIEGPGYIVPSASYQMTRGTLVREQQTGVRTLLMSGVSSFGPLLTGFVPFFHATGPRLNFSQIVNVFSGPVTTGLGAIVPDTIAGHLIRLEQQSFKNDNQSTRTIIENNTQYSSVTFFPRHFLDGYFRETKRNCATGLGNQSRGKNPGDQSASNQSCYKNPDDPQDVMEALGNIVLIGEQVQFVNRISFNSKAIKPSGQEFSISGRVTEKECGVGVPNITVKLTGDSAFAASTAKTDNEGKYKFDKVASGSSYKVEPQADSNVTFPNFTSLDLTLDSDTNDVNFPATLSSYAIKVNVVDTKGLPVSGVELNLTGDKTDKGTTGADGTFVFSGLKPKAHTVTPKAGSTDSISPQKENVDLTGNCHLREVKFIDQKKQ